MWNTLQRLVMAGLVGSSAFLAGAPGLHAAASTRATQYAPGTPGLAGLVNGRASSAAHGASSTLLRGARPTRAPRTGSTSAARVPTAAGAGLGASSSHLLGSFNGVSSRDSGVTNFGAEFEPPDQGLCVGNGFVLEPVNSAYRVYHGNGSTMVGPFNVNDIFNVGAEEFTSDPRCHYDASTNTWFATILFINDTFDVSKILVAVNTSGDPSKLWTEYQFDTTDNGANGEPKNRGCPCLGDQPTLGIDGNNLYVTTNEFSLLGPQFNGAQIYAIAKSDLVARRAAAHFVHFGHLQIGGAVAASVQPALTTGASPAEFFLSSLDPSGTGDNRLGVWAMTRTAAVASGHSPTLSSRVIASEAYGLPPAASQKGSTSKIDSGDDRMQQTQFINGVLWGELTTAVNVRHDSTTRAGAAWFAVAPHLSGSLLGSASTRGQGYEAEVGHYLLYPALQADSSGRAVMVFTRTGSNVFPSAAYAVMEPGQAAFSAAVTAAAGSGPYDPNAGRWGDYSWAVLAPDGKSFWLATEYMPPATSQTPDHLRNWGTRVLHVCGC